MTALPATAGRSAPVIDTGAFFDCEVTQVRHYTGTLFSFRAARPQSLRFRAGEFVMIGLAALPSLHRDRRCAVCQHCTRTGGLCAP